MMVRFSPRSEFQPLERDGNVSSPLPVTSCPRLERGEFAQTLIDIATLLFGAMFFAVLIGAVWWAGWALFIVIFMGL